MHAAITIQVSPPPVLILEEAFSCRSCRGFEASCNQHEFAAVLGPRHDGPFTDAGSAIQLHGVFDELRSDNESERINCEVGSVPAVSGWVELMVHDLRLLSQR